MCFHSQQSKDAQTVEKRFNAKIKNKTLFNPGIYNGFTFPKTPVITSNAIEDIQHFEWGLLPAWATTQDFRKNTLNARLETLHEKPTFKNNLNQRCLILSDGFFEWKWLDSKGKQKEKYLITLPDQTLFAYAGLWSEWVNKETGELHNTYSIITHEANALMSEIHNTKKRMPFILHPSQEADWLDLKMVKPNMDIDLKAEIISM